MTLISRFEYTGGLLDSLSRVTVIWLLPLRSGSAGKYFRIFHADIVLSIGDYFSQRPESC